MKNFVLFLIVLSGGLRSAAQNINPESDLRPMSNGIPVVVVHTHRHFSRVCIDVNTISGRLDQRINTVDPAANYQNALNTKVSGIKFSNGASRGIDAEIGCYFDVSGRYGIGTGIMYMRQNGDLTMDNFHIEYKSVDNFNNTFRQVLTANGPIKEKLGIDNFSIPLLFKYKIKFSEMIGFNADAGLLFNIIENSHYKTNANFDYEAIYQYSGTQGNLVPVYDYSASPAAGDFLLTKSQYLSGHPASGVQNYFNSYRNEGYNVGLGVGPATNKGAVSSITGSVGLLLRPSFNFVLSHAISVNAGVYYLFQNFKHDAPTDYRLTNKVGEYDPLVNSVKTAKDNSYGFTFGASYSFHRVHHMAARPVVEDTSSVQNDEENDSKDESPAPAGGMNGRGNKPQIELSPVISEGVESGLKAEIIKTENQ